MSTTHAVRPGTEPGTVIIGASHAGITAALALREHGYDAPVTVVEAEPGTRYMRPPLSKAFLNGQVDAAGITLRPPQLLAEKKILLRTGTRVTDVDRPAKTLRLARSASVAGFAFSGAGQYETGEELAYDQLILATGTRARRLPLVAPDTEGVFYLRTRHDAERLRAALDAHAEATEHRTEHQGDVLILGAGFIGLEVAAAAVKLGRRVTVLDMAPRPLGRSASAELAEHLAHTHRHHGAVVRMRASVSAVQVSPGAASRAADRRPRVRAVELDGGEILDCAALVVGIGVEVNDHLAREAGLAVDNGVVVDASLRTSDPAIWAIGDCASFPDPVTCQRIRLESVQNATDQARHVARQIVHPGQPPTPYVAVPWFWTDQYGLKVQIAGLTAGHDHTVLLGNPQVHWPEDGFSLLCFAGERLLGVESVNKPADHMAARRLLGGKYPLPTPADASAPDFDLRGWLAAVTPAVTPERPKVTVV